MKTFTDIAPYYDLLMRDVDYREWTDYIIHLINRAGIPDGSSLLDVACGTGSAAALFAGAGFRVSGMDLSASMLKEARRKAKGLGNRIKFWRADLSDFRVREKQDVITCLFDSLNYLPNDDSVQKACRCILKALKSKGLFIFDINTPFALSKYWDKRLEVKEAEGVLSVWRNSYNWASRHANLSLTVFAPRGKGYRRIEEFHQEKAFPLEDVESMLKKTGFGKIEIFKHLTLEPPQTNTIRVTIIAYKK